MRFSLTIASALFCASTSLAGSSPHKGNVFNKVRNPVIEKRSPDQPFQNPRIQKRASRWLTDATKKFAVNGTGIPDVPFDIGESYAGLLPISSDPNETRELFFWFFPTTNADAGEELAIWFNGGPGCSSLSGLLTENGPFTWEAGTLAPVLNSYSWTNLTNMMWLEQPVGVGFTQGTPNITNEVELGQQLIGFYKNFVNTFDVHGWDVYLTGESYGGYYVPYIADAFINANDTDYYNLKGISINDPIIGDETNQQQVVILDYVRYWNDLMYLNETFLDRMQQHQDFCNYTSYMDTYLTFPPPAGKFPVLPDPYYRTDVVDLCDVFDDFYSAILEVNPCFNIYHITETCPHLYSELGIVNTGDYSPPGAVVYFNRTDVQKAINAPVGTNWLQCSDINVFGNGDNYNFSIGDTSLGPAQDGVLEHVIETTGNVIIGSGNLDMLLNTNGTLLAIQNMTWGGKQGLQSYPDTPLYTPYHPEYNGGSLAGAGSLGYWGKERGLTFYQVQLAGHELPGYAPGAAYRMLEILLGRVANFSSTEDFTTQSGNYTGNGTIYKRGVEYLDYY